MCRSQKYTVRKRNDFLDVEVAFILILVFAAITEFARWRKYIAKQKKLNANKSVLTKLSETFKGGSNEPP